MAVIAASVVTPFQAVSLLSAFCFVCLVELYLHFPSTSDSFVIGRVKLKPAGGRSTVERVGSQALSLFCLCRGNSSANVPPLRIVFITGVRTCRSGLNQHDSRFTFRYARLGWKEGHGAVKCAIYFFFFFFHFFIFLAAPNVMIV